MESSAKIPHFSMMQRMKLLSFGLLDFKIPTDATADELLLLGEFAKRKDNIIIVEIGSYLGASSLVISSANKKATLYCVDTWNNDAMSEGNWDTMKVFLKNTRKCKNIKTLRMWSTEAVEKIENEIDMIFIDGDHSYSGVKADVDLYFPKIKRGGIICMHDYGWAEGVQKVVHEDLIPNVSEYGNLPNLFWAIKK